MTRRLSLLAFAALLAAACLYVFKLEVPYPHSYSAAGITDYSTTTKNGTVEMTATADSVISVNITRRCYGRNREDAEAYIDNIVITDTVEGGRLTVDADMPSGDRNYGADFVITAPDSVRVNLHTSNGSLTVTGMTGGGSVRTSNAAVTLTGTSGSFSLSTSNGKVSVRVHTGGVDISTSNGAVDCDLTGLGPTESALIRTSNGAVTLLLPADVSASFDASSSNGEVTVAPGFGSIAYTRQDRDHKTGTIGSGAATIEIETSNGAVIIRPR